MVDPIVRVRWWNATADILSTAKGIDLERVMNQLAERVPLPTPEEEIVFDYWPHQSPWIGWPVEQAAAQRASVARTARRLAVDHLRPGDVDWEDAVSAWHTADAAFERGDWEAYVRYEREGLDFIGRAIPKARKRPAPANICADAWLESFQAHVRRLDERRAQREVEQARRRAEEDRRRRQQADEERRQAADEKRRRARGTRSSTGTRSVVDRMNNGSPMDWAGLLGVGFPCTRHELKRAHREAVRKHHPDLGGDAEMMKAVNIAKEMLDGILEPIWTAQAVN